MALKKIENRELLYYIYNRESSKDAEQFRQEMTNVSGSESGTKDIVVDFSGSSCISSPEISSIVRVLKFFQGTLRSLRIIATPELIKMIQSTNIHKLPNLVLYKDKAEFAAHLRAQQTS